MRVRSRPAGRRGRAALLLLLLAAAALAVAPLPRARGAVPVLVFEGRGWGHGVGMSQDGALWMGRDGAGLGDILGHFYPGTGIGHAGGQLRVVVLSRDDRRAVVTFPGGGEVRSPLMGDQAPGFPVRVSPGGSVLLRHDGSGYVAEPGPGATVSTRSPARPRQIELPTTTTVPLPESSTTTTTAPPSTTTTTAPSLTEDATTTTAPPQTTTTAAPAPAAGGGEARSPHPLWAVPADGATIGVPDRDARYRGVVEATVAAGPLRLVNHVDVEQYLRGMGEIRSPSWPAAALQAQAVAARTYALRAMAVSGELCDTQRCQVYLGQQAEYAEMDAAVAATAGQVLTYGGRLATAVYSASGGGHSATPEEGFGVAGSGAPYLRAAPYLTRDPKPWEISVAVADVARRAGYPGAIERVEVTRAGPSGRAIEVTLHGDAGARPVNGVRFARALGLRSTLWTMRTDVADEAPVPPPATETALQVLPEDVDDVVAEESRRVTRRAVRPPAPTSSADDQPWGVALALVGVVVAAGTYGGWTVHRAERRATR